METSPSMAGNNLGHKFLKKKKLEEEGNEGRRERASLRFVYSFFPPLFSFVMMAVFSLKMF